MKITKERLEEIVREEVNVYVLQEKLTDKEKKKKTKLKDELDDLEHKWMKEGKLSSALVKHFHLNESVGKVLWHSLGKSGRIGEYDMKFGDTIIRGLLPEEVTPVIVQKHSHSPQERDDK